MKERTRLAIADDAFFMRAGLRRLLDAEQRIEVVGAAATGEELIERLDEWQPDVVTLDLDMPGMGGLATLDRVLAWRPVPVIILSARTGVGAPATLEAMSRGAFDFIDKSAHSLVDFEGLRAILVKKVLEAASHAQVHVPRTEPLPRRNPNDIELIVIGASTGGPRAIEAVLAGIGEPLPVPIVIVQHMPAGFTHAFAARLDRLLPMHVFEAGDGDVLLPGTAAVAPAGTQLRVTRTRQSERMVVRLLPETGRALHVPSVDVLFDSAAHCAGERAIAVLLTGMGADGADGMLTLARAGAHTIAQDEPSCVVYGMPRAAVLLGGVNESLPLEQIGARLHGLVSKPRCTV